MHDTERMRAFERAGILTAGLIAAATIYAFTGNGVLAVGIATLAVLIVVVVLKLERLADRAVDLIFRLLTLPFRMLRRMLGA